MKTQTSNIEHRTSNIEVSVPTTQRDPAPVPDSGLRTLDSGRPLSPRANQYAKQKLSSLLSDVMRLELRRLTTENLMIGRRIEVHNLMRNAPVYQTTGQGE